VTEKPDAYSTFAVGEQYWNVLISFPMPSEPSADQSTLIKDIVRLDHRSLHTLSGRAKERGEVRDLLVNVGNLLLDGQTVAARALFQNAEDIFLQHIQARNRLRYLLGVLMGVVVMIGFAAIFSLSGVLDKELPLSVPLIVLFAGMGAITSVLTRLSSINLRDQTSNQLIYISGASRPVTAVFLSIVICLVLALQIIEIHAGIVDGDAAPVGLYLIAAFLSGFSERWAKDVLARVGGIISGEHGTGESDESAAAARKSRHARKS
jgi:hypothetical protein